MLTQEKLKHVLFYDPIDGTFIWKHPKGHKAKPGDVAGFRQASGHIAISIDGKTYKAHRLAWLYMTGEFPTKRIDHKNRKAHDNSFENLRLCTNSQNMNNIELTKANKSGIRGVSWNKQRNKWQVNISVDGKVRYVGLFEDFEEAKQARIAASLTYHGEFSPYFEK